MSYIGAQPTTAAFVTDTFSANGSGTVFTLSVAPANTNSILVAVSGVLQDPSTYSVSGTALTFSAAPPAGTGNISVRFLGIPASGVTTTAYRTVTEFTATAGQTTFSVPSYTVGYIDVYRNGALLGSADFTATNGTTVVLANAASSGDLIETVSFFVSSVANAVPTTGGTFSGNVLFASGNGIWNTSGNVGIGTTSPNSFYSEARNLVVGSGTGGQGMTIFAGAANQSRLMFADGTSGTDPYTGFVQYDHSSNAMTFGTNGGTERMRIDSGGNVTMPFQVSFSAIAYAVQNTTIPFGNAATYSNVGNGLNTSTGVFTAPVAGTYLFTSNVLANGGQADMQLSINGVYRSSCRGNSTTASMALIYTMAAGDTARVVTNGVQAYGDTSGWSIFNGRLLG